MIFSRSSPLAVPDSPNYLSGTAIFLLMATTGTSVGFADPPQPISFDQDIAPLLSRRCVNCHNASEKKGGLNLLDEASTQSGGDSGAAITAGKPDESLLWERIVGDEMPPKHPLTAVEKATVRQWIADGAQWGSGPIDPFRFSTDDRAGFDWWSLQPIE